MVIAIPPGGINGVKSGTLELACHPSALCGAFYLNGIFLIWTLALDTGDITDIYRQHLNSCENLEILRGF